MKNQTLKIIFLTTSFITVSQLVIGLYLPSLPLIVGFVFPNANTGFIKPFPLIAGTAAALSGFLQMLGSGIINIVTSALHFLTPTSLGLSLAVCGILTLLIYFAALKPVQK